MPPSLPPPRAPPTSSHSPPEQRHEVSPKGEEHALTSGTEAPRPSPDGAPEALARAEAEAAVRLRDELKARLLEEVKAPLFDISLHARLLERLPAATPEAEARRLGYVTAVHQALAYANLLLAATLDVVHGDDGGAVGDLRMRAVADLVELAARVVQPLLRARGVTLATRVHEGIQGIRCDHAQMTRALAALLANGVRRAPPGGRVRLGVAHTGVALQFSVRDGGPPLDDAVFARLVTVAEGSGHEPSPLHLAAAHRILALHGGSLRVNHDDDGSPVLLATLPPAPEA